MKKKRKTTRRGVIPDEHFESGPLEFARFGRVMIGRSRATEAQHAKLLAKMAARLPKVHAEIEGLVQSIAVRITRLPAGQLLQRAWWEFVTNGFGQSSPDDMKQAAAMRMIDYVQSVVASVSSTDTVLSELTRTDWAELKKDVGHLFGRLTVDYQMCRMASRKAQSSEQDMALEEFRFKAEVLWMNVRGSRYQPHEYQALLDIIAPHSDILLQLFGVDAPTLVRELNKILLKRTTSLVDLKADMAQVQHDVLTKAAELWEKEGVSGSRATAAQIYADDPALEARMKKLTGEMFGLDLFDVEMITTLPRVLLNELVWSPGEDEEFFAEGEFRGWPLRVWPIMKRPFIQLDGRILCFDLFALFDNFYRILQRVIFRLAPDYRGVWNERQKEVSEQLPFSLFERLLPGATMLTPVYYRWKVGAGAAQWHEADGLVVYDDHLFVVEIKAGAFTYTSPATDLPAHLSSLRNLVLNPASQGNRFVDFLESGEEVSVADSDHNEIGKLRRADFRHVTVCAVTLDAFTELAARAQHLRDIGLDVGQRPVWVLSIDDLRVYADLCGEPLRFLHFVEQRMRAARSALVDVNDEIDHLGLYLKENNYSMYAAELVGSKSAKLTLSGYRTPIDAYYSALVRGKPIGKPQQELPAPLNAIIQFLTQSSRPGRSRLASFMLDWSGEFRRQIGEAISNDLRGHTSLRRSLPISTFDDVRITLFTSSPSAPRQAEAAVDHTRAVMAAADEERRMLLELEYATGGELIDVHWSEITFDGVQSAELDVIRQVAEKLRGERVLAAKAERKIGVNEACPCGSQRKYKHCCRAGSRR